MRISAALRFLTLLLAPFLYFSSGLAGPPNVLLILTDDQGYGDLSLHGNAYLNTPHLDKLGRNGIQFERFYVNSFCAPTRAALLTGRYPVRTGTHGVTHNRETMRSNEVTIGEAFQAAGYRTTCIGKWHNGEQYPYTPPGQGFDDFFGFHNGHINNYFHTKLLRGSKPVETSGYITDTLTDEALRFIRENRRSPFFCYLAYNAPHSPYQVPDKYYDRFASRGFDPSVSAFWGMVENIDDNVGRLLQELDAQQLAENTIVLFLTDNGGTAGVKIYNAGMRGGKTSVHEGGSRVPLFVRFPQRFKAPRTVTQLTSHIDLLPTLMELCGVGRPENSLALDGMSLVPLMEGREENWPQRTLFTHNPISETNRYPGAVRTEQYRLVREIKGPQGGSSARPNDGSAPPWQLYDMLSDPGEKQDLASQKPDIVADLSARYEAWIDDIFDDGLERLPIQIGHLQENPVTLHAPQATFDGKQHFFSGPGFAHDWLTNWTAGETISFDLEVVTPGKYSLLFRYGAEPSLAAATLETSCGRQQLLTPLIPATPEAIALPHRDERGRARYNNRRWGELELGAMQLPSGRQTLRMHLPSGAPKGQLDFKELQLTRKPTSD